MKKFLTLNKNDSRYNDYIWGSFSKSEYAIPVESLNDTTLKNVVTFLIQDKTSFAKPSFLRWVTYLIKWKYFSLLYIPLYLVIAKNILFNRFFDPLSLALSAIAASLLFAGLNIRNDVIDHISGYDRIISSGKIKPIMKGWINATEASKISWWLIVSSALFAVPVFFRQPESIRVAIIVSVLFLIGNFIRKNSYKDKYFAEFILFLLFGPGLLSGYQVALGSGVDTEILALGTLWGFGVLFLFYLNQLRYLFNTSKSNIVNTITKMGFDESKNFLVMWWCVFIILWALFHKFYSSTFWAFFTSFTLIFWSFPTFIKIAASRSPMGSELKLVYKIGIRNFVLMIFLIVLEATYYLVNHFQWIM